jgi:hypothetical protein
MNTVFNWLDSLAESKSRLASHAERIICPGCKNEIDPDVCGCGDSKENHTGWEGHPFIPMGCDCYRVSPAGPDALAEEQVREAAKILAISPLIESPKGLTAENWMGLARQVLHAALRSRPEDRGNAEIGKRVRQLVDGGPFDLRDSPMSFTATCERLVAEADATMAQQEKKDG